jgi:hypothetical protein
MRLRLALTLIAALAALALPAGALAKHKEDSGLSRWGFEWGRGWWGWQGQSWTLGPELALTGVGSLGGHVQVPVPPPAPAAPAPAPAPAAPAPAPAPPPPPPPPPARTLSAATDHRSDKDKQPPPPAPAPAAAPPALAAVLPEVVFRARHGTLKVLALTSDVVVTCFGRGWRSERTAHDGVKLIVCRGVGRATVKGTDWHFRLKAKVAQAKFPAGLTGNVSGWGFWWSGADIPDETGAKQF